MKCPECGGNIVEEDGEEFCGRCGIKPTGPTDLNFRGFMEDVNSEDSEYQIEKGLSEIERIGLETNQPSYITDKAKEVFRTIVDEQILQDESTYFISMICSNVDVEISGGSSTRTSIIESGQSVIEVEDLESLSDKVIKELELDKDSESI